MITLACTDIQCDHGACSWLAETAPRLEFDALVLTGDLPGLPEGYVVVSV